MASVATIDVVRLNERRKLLAAMVNNFGGALLAASVARVYAEGGMTWPVAFDLIVWVPVALVLISLSFSYLRLLEPEE